jgi:ABC-type uncharacterized transport system permease subunit
LLRSYIAHGLVLARFPGALIRAAKTGHNMLMLHSVALRVRAFALALSISNETKKKLSKRYHRWNNKKIHQD